MKLSNGNPITRMEVNKKGQRIAVFMHKGREIKRKLEELDIALDMKEHFSEIIYKRKDKDK